MTVKMRSGDYLHAGPYFENGVRRQDQQDALIIDMAMFQGFVLSEDLDELVKDVTLRGYLPDTDECQVLAEVADDAIEYLNGQISEDNHQAFAFGRREGDFLLLPEREWQEVA